MVEQVEEVTPRLVYAAERARPTRWSAAAATDSNDPPRPMKVTVISASVRPTRAGLRLSMFAGREVAGQAAAQTDRFASRIATCRERNTARGQNFQQPHRLAYIEA